MDRRRGEVLGAWCVIKANDGTITLLAEMKQSLFIVEIPVDDESWADEIKIIRTRIAQDGGGLH